MNRYRAHGPHEDTTEQAARAQRSTRGIWIGLGASIAAGYLLGRMIRRARPPILRGQHLALPGAADSAALAQGSIFFVGTATTIIRYGGFTILTDPNFLHAGDHAHLGYGISVPRLTNPAIEIDQLPPVDLCLLSHMHGDHWDHIAATQLPRTLPIATTAHAAEVLRRQGFQRPLPLSTWQTLTLTRGDVYLRITALPGKHGPGPLHALLPPVMGSMLEWGVRSELPRFRLYISGDTLAGDYLRDIPRYYPDIDLALLHLGGTRLFGLLLTMDAQQGVRAIRIIRPQAVVPIHYNDYPVFRSPIADFLRAAAEARLDVDIHYLGHGETYTFAVPVSRTSLARI